MEQERAYRDFAEGLVATGILSDPWLDGQPRFRREPVFLARDDYEAVCAAAESVAAVYDEVVRLCTADATLLERFFGLTPWQEAMFRASAPHWHGIARADVFLTDRGPQICELNCDTPSGEAEAVLLGALAHAEHPDCFDPSAQLGSRFCRMIEAVAPRRDALCVGIVYPTELTEDLSMILLYREWFRARGWSVALGSPFNLRRSGRGVALLGQPCDVIVRHYKTDWWGERLAVWHDDLAFADPRPLEAQLAAVLASACAVVNPFAAVVPQNKRAMALMWECMDRFSPAAQAAIRAHVPETVRLEGIDSVRLLADKDDWVLKSDYGCEGAEVLVGRETPADSFAEALVQVVRSRWIAQRWFAAQPSGDGATTNLGVYLVAGERAGLFSRMQRGATDRRAVTAPTLVMP